MKCTKILSAAAKAIIARAIAADQYQKMDNRYEPPFMAPSLEPALYSDVSVSYPFHCHHRP